MPKEFFHAIYRPTQAHEGNLPFSAKIVGHFNLRPPSHRFTSGVRDYVQVIWCIKGTGIVIIKEKKHRIQPRQIGVYIPDMQHEFYPVNSAWECRWWAMDGHLAPTLASGLGLTAGIHDTGEAPDATFRLLEKTIQNQSPAAERQASAIAYQLLVMAVPGPRADPGNTRVQEAVRIIHGEWNQPQFSVKQLADRLSLHRSDISRRFKAELGISPVVYLTRLRVQKALTMLKTTNSQVADIAAMCGYHDPNYFSRLIRHYTGSSPLRFRQGKPASPRLNLRAEHDLQARYAAAPSSQKSRFFHACPVA